MPTTSTYLVTGMTCDHCVRSVRDAVGALPGVVGVEIALATGELTVDAVGPVEDEAVRRAVDEAGYQVADR